MPVYVCGYPHAVVAALDSFFIEVVFVGTWTNARMAVFESAADR